MKSSSYSHVSCELCKLKGNFPINYKINGTSFISESVHFISVAQSCPTLCNPMNCSTPGVPVHHQLPEFTQTHVHWVSDAIQPISSAVVPFSSCTQSLPPSESFPMSQLFAWGGQSTRVSPLASFLPKNTQGWPPLEYSPIINILEMPLWTVHCTHFLTFKNLYNGLILNN